MISRSSVDELIDLRSKREYVEPKKHVDERTVLPFPVTTASEVKISYIYIYIYLSQTF